MFLLVLVKEWNYNLMLRKFGEKCFNFIQKDHLIVF